MTFIVAEGGCNHQGDLGTAILLANAAKECGADTVKYQHFRAADLQPERYDLLKPLELTDAEMLNIKWHCDAIGIEFMCTPFGVRECEFLAPLLKRVKVASGCLTNWPLLAAVKATRLPVILSTGMSDEKRIDAALAELGYYSEGTPVTLLQCTSAYPCRAEDANLRAMDELAQAFSAEVGFSDHTQGITVALAAVARGATVLEKHLTLDRNAEGPDHKASIEPDEFRIMVNAIRTIEAALGDGRKVARECEAETRRTWYGDPR